MRKRDLNNDDFRRDSCRSLPGDRAGDLYLLAGERLASQREKTRLDFLLERKEQLYENLRDLNFEFKAGEIS